MRRYRGAAVIRSTSPSSGSQSDAGRAPRRGPSTGTRETALVTLNAIDPSWAAWRSARSTGASAAGVPRNWAVNVCGGQSCVAHRAGHTRLAAP